MKTKKTELQRVRESAQVQSSQLAKFRKFLTEIACMGDGIKESNIDWSAIGKDAKYKAQEAIKPRCSTCGK